MAVKILIGHPAASTDIVQRNARWLWTEPAIGLGLSRVRVEWWLEAHDRDLRDKSVEVYNMNQY